MADQSRGRGRGRGAGRGSGPPPPGAGRGRGQGQGEFRGNRGGGRGEFRGNRGRGGGDFRGDRGGPGFRGRGGRGGGPVRVWGGGDFPQPDADISKLEDATVKGDLTTTMAKTSINELSEFPKRPGYGRNGRSIVLWTNYFELKGVSADATLYRYNVSFQSDSELAQKKNLKKKLVHCLIEQAPFFGIPIASDWSQLLIAPKKVPLEGNRQAFTIQLDAKTRYMALVEMQGTMSVEELLKDTRDPSINYPLRSETIQALNLILAHGASTDPNMVTVTGNKFYPFGKHPQFQYMDLGAGLQAYRGYFTSVRTSVNRILVNINVATSAFYNSCSLLELMREFKGSVDDNNPYQHKLIANFVRRLRVETNYLKTDDGKGTKKKIHTIQDLSPQGKSSANITFKMKGDKAKTISVQNFFRETYKIQLQVPQAPCINTGSKDNPVWIPVELCTVSSGQLAKRHLSAGQTSDMLTFAARPPFENAKSITEDGLKVTKIQSGSGQATNNLLNKFGIQVLSDLLTVPGRILQAPSLKYREKSYIPTGGAWNLQPANVGLKPFLIAKEVGTWGCLVINSGGVRYDNPQAAIRKALVEFQGVMLTYGLRPGTVGEPLYLDIKPSLLQPQNCEQIRASLENAIKNCFTLENLKFLFIILPNDNAVLYDCIKYSCDINLGILNICSIGKKFAKDRNIGYHANVILKVNQKLGGVNHQILLENLKPLDEHTIVFGIDVTHPSPGSSESSPSIAGVVASVDSKFSQFPASMRTQTGRTEMVQELKDMILERLRLWQIRNQNRLPKKVIVYRDGVSEGQYDQVLKFEYSAFQEAFKTCYGKVEKHPKISIIIVGKRHNTRFYPTKVEESDAKAEGNPLPGTVVDRGVTGEKIFDFFLLAHQGIKGTSKPAHYVVIKDDNKLGADQLQQLTHNLCYTFARATRSVSICPPAYYADILCERGRCYLHAVLKGGDTDFDRNRHWTKDVHDKVKNVMYYI